MPTEELQKAKEAISLSSLSEIAELAAALRARLQALGANLQTIGFGPEPMPGQADTWEEIEADFARHDAGEKGFTLEEMRRLARPKTS
jgi:alkanesulfonate monooxygenase SsuD/methylene tetrahydromethanopterin reductase-like flavin-dependent oxidoreductase (luciferase family)